MRISFGTTESGNSLTGYPYSSWNGSESSLFVSCVVGNGSGVGPLEEADVDA